MTLTLVIETSSNISSVAIGSGKGVSKEILFDSDSEFAGKKYVEVSFLVQHGLKTLGKSIHDIEAIAVDAGPGRLMSIRNGIAFANAIAFASNTNLYALCSFDLMGFEAWQAMQMPIICTAKGSNGNAYVCLYTQGECAQTKFGPLAATVQTLTAELPEFAVAGEYRDALTQLATPAQVHDSTIQLAKASTFFKLNQPITDPKFLKQQIVTPVNEHSFIA